MTLIKRIVSLVPSQTELLYDLGLDAEVVGVTKFCVHPEEWRQSKAIVGGTKNVDHKIVDSLRPDLIIGNKEENTKEDVELLMKKHRVWISDVSTIEEAFVMMKNIGEMTGREAAAAKLISDVQRSFSTIRIFETKKTLFLIWRKPWMAAGTDTFISSMMKVAGFENIIVTTRYPKLTHEEIASLKPEVVLLSSEPYPFGQQHLEEVRKIVPAAEVKLVDGEMFSWYGSRMMEAAGYFEELRSNKV